MSPQDKSSEKKGLGIYLLPLGIFAGLVILFSFGLGLNPRLIPSPLIDQPAPVFSLPKLYKPDELFQQTNLQGEVSLFNIWATWCPSCKQEHPVLMKIAETGSVPIYGLYYKDDPAAGREWLKTHGDPYQANAVDRNGKVGIEWGAYGTPETFVIDQQGIVRYKHVGPISWQDWQDVLLPVIQSLRDKSDV
ncbi:MAG: DsbE family thiol:disulfide interchange protein [Thiotrichales bacterium]|nr:DsbE family thiol:disulfide interchange protein [Thiotrichales bacterium]